MPRSFRAPPLVALAVVLSGLGVAAVKSWHVFDRPIVPGEVQVFFSPKGGCASAVIEVLRGAKKSVLVQAYSFTNAAIARALVDAHRRGVEVKIILDKSQQTERYTEADFTARAGIPTWIDSAHGIAHNKVMIIDGATIITGSFNFTKAAEESNAENLVILRETPALASKYEANWQAHRSHSTKFTAEGRGR